MSKTISILDNFWKKKQQKMREKMIPHQWLALNDELDSEEKSHAVRNLKLAAKALPANDVVVDYGDFGKESDLCKWMEATAYALKIFRDESLEKIMDDLSGWFASAQAEDGYLNTYYIAKGEKQRFGCLSEMHELYCAGHLIEAAVAYYQATGKTVLLNAVKKYADYLCDVFGEEDGKNPSYDGHEEIELALVRLWEVTDEDRYLRLSEHFVRIRGTQPSPLASEDGFRTGSKWFSLDYYQAHAPLKQQNEVVGHAVRAMYLYCGATDIARITEDKALYAHLKSLWRDLVDTKMFITGGIGSEVRGERFGKAYDLPVDRAYNETCASIGLALWARRMLKIEANAEYADVMERALYNTILSGVSHSGEKYFYVNPLRVVPDVTEIRWDSEHIKTERVSWFGCACCPPNIARTLGSLGEYVWTESEKEIRMELWIPSVFSSENDVVEMTGELFKGEFTVRNNAKRPVRIRAPYWAETIAVNGRKADIDANGYFAVAQGENAVCVRFTPRFVYPNPLNDSSSGKVALSYGPFVYCMEEADNGKNLSALRVGVNGKIREIDSEGFSAPILSVEGERISSEKAYSYFAPEKEKCELVFVPYCDWNNRGKGEMAVYVSFVK